MAKDRSEPKLSLGGLVAAVVVVVGVLTTLYSLLGNVLG